ncbi:carboxypeptidase-like regulatory domain-containing protein [Hyphobacterium sp. CCMP332]|nr:carboxypeptidase-like regulatory domain-containing protein [Hyphobacterium sp. CCMP332]
MTIAILKKSSFLLFILFLFISVSSTAQTTVTGQIKDAENNDELIGVNVYVKGTVTGTITNSKGEFELKTNTPRPFTLVISSVGYNKREIEITEDNQNVEVALETQSLLGQEVVVSASRVEESILESPVSIEKMDILAIQNTPADNYYKGIANLKGVDVATSSINFQIINTRGFGSTGNTRFVQLTDGMDTQAPALNFPIGNLNGPSELDVESVELIPGAASALYGPNAFNGIMLVNSKNAFDYQGLSAFVKSGFNHVGADADQNTAPIYEGSLRYAKAFGNRVAFKVNASYQRADDWHGTDLTDRFPERRGQLGITNPGADRLHTMGDEAGINLAIFNLSTDWQTLARTKTFGINEAGDDILAASDYARDLPSQVVTAKAWQEEYLVDYSAENIKFNGGLYYRITEGLEASYQYNYGAGTSIYTGAQRYSLKNFNIQQHQLKLKGENFFIRGYTTIEQSGDSYIAEFLAKRMNDIAMQRIYNNSENDVSRYLADYGVEYLRSLYDQGLEPGEFGSLSDQNKIRTQEIAHLAARSHMDSLYTSIGLVPGTEGFNEIKDEAGKGIVPEGPKFNDNSRMDHVEGQYDFTKQVPFLDGLQVGGNYRQFVLRSNGTIFPDKESPITINEFGGYVQASKYLLDEKLKLTSSLRYDKNQNFDGQYSPRISGVFKIKEIHNIRASFQTGFRIPTTQGQYIDLSIISARLLGGLPETAERYRITENAYTISSVNRYSQAVFDAGATTAAANDPSNIALLQPFDNFEPVKPERVRSFEVGYKSLIDNKLLIDFAVYYNIYLDFITQVQLRKVSLNSDGTENYASLVNGEALTIQPDGTLTGNTAQIYTNIDDQVTTQGAAIGIQYVLPKNYTIGGNYSYNSLNEDLNAQGFLAEYNTPEHKTNLSFGNREVIKNIGFSITYRWQDAFLWQSSFAVGEVPAYSTLDAQVSYKMKELKTILKIGASNALNNRYIQSKGGPNIGGLYYISLTFDELMN